MAIDARVVGVRRVEGELVKLTLEDRGMCSPAGQNTLVLMNCDNIEAAADFIQCELWGGSGCLMLGDEKIADRDGYTMVRLVDNWELIVAKYHRNRGLHNSKGT